MLLVLVLLAVPVLSSNSTCTLPGNAPQLELKTCLGQNVRIVSKPFVVNLTRADGTFSVGFRTVNGSLHIHSSYLEVFKLPRIVTGNGTAAGELSLQQNDHLKRLDFPRIFTTEKMVVRGNRRLHWDALSRLKKAAGGRGYVQDYGECYFGDRLAPAGNGTSSVKHLMQLQGCYYILGSLSILPEAEGDWPETLTEIRGCLKISGTYIRNGDFLKKLRIKNCGRGNYILNNEFLEVPRNVSGLWGVAVQVKGNRPNCNGGLDSDGMDKSCERYNSRCRFNSLPSDASVCSEAIDGVTVVGGVFSQQQHSVLLQLKRIGGPLAIIRTGLATVDFLPQLETVDVERAGPAIEITANERLKAVAFPSLRHIFQKDDGPAIRIRSNGRFKMSKEQFSRMEEQFGQGSLDVDTETHWLVLFSWIFGTVVVPLAVLVPFCGKERREKEAARLLKNLRQMEPARLVKLRWRGKSLLRSRSKQLPKGAKKLK